MKSKKILISLVVGVGFLGLAIWFLFFGKESEIRYFKGTVSITSIDGKEALGVVNAVMTWEAMRSQNQSVQRIFRVMNRESQKPEEIEITYSIQSGQKADYVFRGRNMEAKGEVEFGGSDVIYWTNWKNVTETSEFTRKTTATYENGKIELIREVQNKLDSSRSWIDRELFQEVPESEFLEAEKLLLSL